MKIGKIERLALALAFGGILLAIGLFVAVPFILGSSFYYNSWNSLLAGWKALIAFDLTNTFYLFVVGGIAVAVIFFIAWAIFILAKKKTPLFGAFAICFVLFLLRESLFASYFLGLTELNFVEGNLITLISNAKDQILGQALSYAAIVLLLVSFVGSVMFALVSIASVSISTNGMKKFGDALLEEFGRPERAKASAIFEERKAKEEALFEACVATGEFEQYDELLLPKPLEGFTEEPVFDSFEVEETTKVTKRKVTKVNGKKVVTD